MDKPKQVTQKYFGFTKTWKLKGDVWLPVKNWQHFFINMRMFRVNILLKYKHFMRKQKNKSFISDNIVITYKKGRYSATGWGWVSQGFETPEEAKKELVEVVKEHLDRILRRI